MGRHSQRNGLRAQYPAGGRKMFIKTEYEKNTEENSSASHGMCAYMCLYVWSIELRKTYVFQPKYTYLTCDLDSHILTSIYKSTSKEY